MPSANNRGGADQRKLSTFALIIGGVMILLAGGIATVLWQVPQTIQVFYGGFAGCDDSLKELPRNLPNLPAIAYTWHPRLASLYRWKRMRFGGPMYFEDAQGQRQTALHVLLSASALTNGACDGEILDLFQNELTRGAPIDAYDPLGYTALQTAVLGVKPAFVAALVEHGANLKLKVHRADSKVFDKDVLELVEEVSTKPWGNRWSELRQILLRSPNNTLERAREP